jgi:hypothetical protein
MFFKEIPLIWFYFSFRDIQGGKELWNFSFNTFNPKSKVFVLTADVKIQERLENYEIHLLTNGKVLDDINKIYKGIKIVPNGSNSVIEFS